MSQGVLQIGSCIFAGLVGVFFVRWWKKDRPLSLQRNRSRMGYLSSSDDPLLLSTASRGLPLQMITFMRTRTRIVSLKPRRSIFRQRFWAVGAKSFDSIIGQTALLSVITKAGYIDTRAWSCLIGLSFGALFGIVFTSEMAMLLGCIGAVLGWKAPLWALKQERDTRRSDLENHLSEMLEVLSLGLRSGLSFETSFELYHEHFSNALGRSCLSTQQLWQLGLATRESALRRFATSYDSPLFSRVVENIVRSLRFGSSLADSLEAFALESRAAHRAFMEEKVAKAPVKMLIPTAALILPAMLLLVLGPVLLEMIQGF